MIDFVFVGAMNRRDEIIRSGRAYDDVPVLIFVTNAGLGSIIDDVLAWHDSITPCFCAKAMPAFVALATSGLLADIEMSALVCFDGDALRRAQCVYWIST